MVDELRQALEQAQRRLSDDEQRRLATQIEAWLDEQEWDALVVPPTGRKPLNALPLRRGPRLRAAMWKTAAGNSLSLTPHQTFPGAL